WVSTVLVISNQTRSISTYLAPVISQGSITVHTNVSGAKIFVNGTYMALPMPLVNCWSCLFTLCMKKESRILSRAI
ncbi:MAG: hypothetical protein R6T90_05980, partial [Dissulfuribacterales bacterium]